METRILKEPIEIREEDGKRYIEGYGILFNSESKDLGGFVEYISREALAESDMSDVIGRADHSNDYVLGRTSSGTMKLKIDERGVYYRIEIPDTTVGRDITEYIRRGDMVGSSFAFSGVKDKWEKRGSQNVRTIEGIRKIHDIGPVWNPAYADTSTALRSLEEFENKVEEKKEEKQEEPKKKPQEVGLSLKDKVRLKKLRG